MPTIDLSTIPDPEPRANFREPAPEGWYPLQVTNCLQRYTEDGIEQWEIHLEVGLGPEKGRRVRDWITWGSPDPQKSVQALGRAKLVLHRLGGVDTKTQGPQTLEPECLAGKRQWGYLMLDKPRDNGRVFNRIPFDGWWDPDDGPEPPEPKMKQRSKPEPPQLDPDGQPMPPSMADDLAKYGLPPSPKEEDIPF